MSLNNEFASKLTTTFRSRTRGWGRVKNSPTVYGRTLGALGQEWMTQFMPHRNAQQYLWPGASGSTSIGGIFADYNANNAFVNGYVGSPTTGTYRSDLYGPTLAALVGVLAIGSAPGGIGDGKVRLIGEFLVDNTVPIHHRTLQSHKTFDTGTFVVSTAQLIPAPNGLNKTAIAQTSGEMYVVGGAEIRYPDDDNIEYTLNVVRRFTATGWVTRAGFPVTIVSHRAAFFNGAVYAGFGGTGPVASDATLWSSSASLHLAKYSPSLDSWAIALTVSTITTSVHSNVFQPFGDRLFGISGASGATPTTQRWNDIVHDTVITRDVLCIQLSITSGFGSYGSVLVN